MNRLLLLLSLAFRTRLRGFLSAGASSIFLVVSGLSYLALTSALGAGAYLVLSQSRGARVERFADIASLVTTLFGVFFLTRPLILSNLSGSSLQNLLHLPIRRRELLVYSLLTGVVTPLLLESPVLIGAAVGAASSPALLLPTLPLGLLAHLTLLAGAHAMSLFAVLIARRTWISDLARVFAFAIFFVPSLFNYRGSRDFLGPLIGPLAQISPLGWAARAAVYAGAGEVKLSLWFALPALLLLIGITFLSLSLLNRILAGEGEDKVDQKKAAPRPARVLLPGALGALIETQLRSHLRSPAARMALVMPTLMMAFFAFSLSRPGALISPFVMVVFLSVLGGNAFLAIGRGVALILGTKVSRAAILIASDVSAILFRMPPLLAIIAVTFWRAGAVGALTMAAVALTLIPINLGVQHFVSILRPFTLPRDRFNPFAQRADGQQSAIGFLGLLATLATTIIASPFLFLSWLSSRLDGAFGPWLLALSCLGALASYAILIALAERLFIRRELRMLEVLLDDSPS